MKMGRHDEARDILQATEEVWIWRGRNDILLHGHVRGYLVDHALALPYGGASPNYLMVLSN